MKRVMLLVSAVILGLTVQGWSIRLPLNGDWRPSNRFDNGIIPGWDGYHLAEDILRSSEAPVYAMADGHVYVSRYSDGYGHVIIIEHRLSDGTVFCSLYGHLRDENSIPVGTNVNEGQLIGYLSNKASYNTGVIHLHSGIRMGPYTTKQIYMRNPPDRNHSTYWWRWNWQYPGYSHNANTTETTRTPYDITHRSMVSNWWATSEFVASHQNTFICSYVSQSISPAGPYRPGEIVQCQVTYRNEGTATWRKTSGPNYVKLASCNQLGSICQSFFNFPYDPSLGWLNDRVPCTFNETSVPPHQVATFTFQGRIKAGATPGNYRIYFGPVYNGAVMQGWGGMHYPIEVVSNPNDGLVGHWMFNEGSGNIAHDNSGNGNDGTINGAGWVSGVSGSALLLDGINDFVNVGNAPELNPTNAITLAGWFKPVLFNGTGNDPIIDKGYTSHVEPYYQYHLGVCGYDAPSQSYRKFHFSVAINGQSQNVATPNGIWSQGNWYFVVGTYDGFVQRMFVNGNLMDSHPLTGQIQVFNQNAYFGTYSVNPAFLPGTIDEIRIYNRALIQAEIQVLYNQHLDKYLLMNDIEENEIPFKSFFLSPACPNPFNAQTTIRYNLPAASEVLVEIYDIAGRKLETLISGYQEAGEHEVVWNAEGRPSGMYFYRIKAGEFSETQKCILLK